MNTQNNVSASSAHQESTGIILDSATIGNSQTDTAASIALAGNPSLSDAVQEKLASTGSPAIRQALAINPVLNEKSQLYLAATGSNEVKCQLAKNTSLIESIHMEFADDENSAIRSALAANTSLDQASLDKLMADTDIGVQAALAKNPALTVDLQQRIASSGCDVWVLQNLAKNASLSKALMEKFSVGAVDEIKESLASNPSLPESIQARLIANNHGNVLKIIARNSSLKIAQQAELESIGSIDIRLALLGNPALDVQIKTRIIASFTQSDLSSAERAVEHAEQKADRLNTEYADACEKHYKSMGGIFPSSDAQVEHLYKNIGRVQKKQDAALSEFTVFIESFLRFTRSNGAANQ